MTLRGDAALDEKLTDASQTEARRRAACLGLGIDPSTVRWPSESAEPRELPLQPEHVELSDEEWRAIAPFLPAEAPQASSMSNRDFFNAVLAAMRRGGAWASRHAPAADIEAVRRRFGRWAHIGVFQALAEALQHLDVLPESKRLLLLAGQRAAQLKSRAAR